MTAAAQTGFITAIITILINSALGFLVIKKDPRNSKNIFLFLFIILFGIGSQIVSIGIILAQNNFRTAIFFYQLGAIPYVTSFPLFYLFSRYYLGIKKEKYNLFLIALIIIIAYPTAFIAPDLIFGLEFDPRVNYYILLYNRPLMIFFLISGLYLFFIGLVHFFLALKKETIPVERNRLKYLTIGPFFSFLGIMMLSIPSFHLLPWDMIGITITSLFLSYAVLKYELMDIKIVIQQSLLFTLIISLIMILFIALGYFLSVFGFEQASILPNQNMIISAILIGLVIQYLYYHQQKVVIMLQQEQEISKKNEQMLITAAHELRTPLTIISGNLRNMQSPDKELLLKTFEVSDHLILMVNNIINVSELDQGKLNLNIKPLNACLLIKNIIGKMQTKAQSKKIDLFYKCDVKHSLVMADENILSLVITNLIDNSIKFTNQGKIVVEHRLENNQLVTLISDTGIGIAKELQPLLFNRLQQIDSEPMTRSYGGIGLGLYLSRRLIRIMKGELWLVQSQENKGSVFGFSLPLDKTTDK